MNVGRRGPWGTPNTSSDYLRLLRAKKKPSDVNQADNEPIPANDSPLKRSEIKKKNSSNICTSYLRPIYFISHIYGRVATRNIAHFIVMLLSNRLFTNVFGNSTHNLVITQLHKNNKKRISEDETSNLCIISYSSLPNNN